MKAIGNKIIIKPAKEEGEKKIGNIFVPSNATDLLQIGEVVSIGNGVYKEYDQYDPDLEKGDVVVFYGAGGIPVLFEDEDHLAIQIADIIMKK